MAVSRKAKRNAAPARERGRPRAARSLPAVDASGRVAWITRVGLLLIVCATVALVVYVRLRLAGVPLERDEGEYAYAGQLILKGIPPYALAYNMKFPGTYYAYAALMAVFGQTAWGIRAGLLCVHLATVALVFALGRRLLGTLAAGIGASAFAILALDRWSMGVFAHATHFVLLPAVASLLVLDSARRSGRAWQFVAAGFLVGLAIVMKQQALFFGVLVIGLAAWSDAGAPGLVARLAWRRGAQVVLGLAAAFIALGVVLAAEGVLGRFWFWTFQYAAAYVSETPPSIALEVLAMAWAFITQATAWFWYAGALGLVLLFATPWIGNSRRWLAAWVVAAALSIAPGFFFRPHYFILLMPVTGLLVGVAVASIDGVLARGVGARAARIASLTIFVALAGLYVQGDAHDLFSMQETELIRSLYAENPFLEAPQIGRYLEAHTKPDDRIGVLGSEPEMLFYAHRFSATGYIYTYPLMEPQPFASRMADEMRHEVETARPAYLVVSGIPASWNARPGSDMRIVTWANDTRRPATTWSGSATWILRQGARLFWDADVAAYRPRSESRISVFRRKTGACQSIVHRP